MKKNPVIRRVLQKTILNRFMEWSAEKYNINSQINLITPYTQIKTQMMESKIPEELDGFKNLSFFKQKKRSFLAKLIC